MSDRELARRMFRWLTGLDPSISYLDDVDPSDMVLRLEHLMNALLNDDRLVWLSNWLATYEQTHERTTDLEQTTHLRAVRPDIEPDN